SSAEILPDHYNSELVDALNPVFDVTPAGLISAIVTEKGVIESPDVRKMAVLTQ
ncbi:MAG: methylthioribose-1-phosphate isomerase, partial [Cycloclasticus sp.]